MIPLFKPAYSDLELAAVERVIKSGWWGNGPEVAAFEEEFAEYVNAEYAVAVNSGTMALELAARALRLNHGFVIVPAITFVSTAQAMLHAGARKVVFADIREDTLTIDWSVVQHQLAAMSDYAEYAPRAVVPVWYGGSVDSVPPLPSGVMAIEDCAHAAGSRFAGRNGDIACWSFQAVKNLATGDGGMITTDDEEVAAELKRLRWCGIDRSTWERDNTAKGYGWDYSIPEDGEKAHMCDISAAIGRAQLQQLDERNAIRRSLSFMYNEAFGNLDWLTCPDLDEESSQHLYVVRVPAGHHDRFIRHMLSNGVSAGVHYKPLTHYPHLFGGVPDECPVAERVWRTLVTLPLYPDMTHHEHEHVIAAVRSFKP